MPSQAPEKYVDRFSAIKDKERRFYAAMMSAMDDAVGRVLATRLNEMWKQAVIVENRPGGGTIVGTELAAKAEADGYTLLVATNTITMAPHVAARVPFDPRRDFEPVALLATTPFALVVAPELPDRATATLAGKGVMLDRDHFAEVLAIAMIDASPPKM